jgi:hypothetical protein
MPSNDDPKALPTHPTQAPAMDKSAVIAGRAGPAAPAEQAEPGALLARGDEAELQTRLLHLAFAAVPETLGLTALAVPPFAYLLWPLFAGRAKEVWTLALLASVVLQVAVLWAWRRRWFRPKQH